MNVSFGSPGSGFAAAAAFPALEGVVHLADGQMQPPNPDC
jgi:hypothetical protein